MAETQENEQRTQQAPDAAAPVGNEGTNAQTAPGEPGGPTLQEQLAKAEAAAAEHRDAFLRAKAETENVRKRGQADVAAAHKYAVEGFATELLAVKDALEAGLATENASAESLKSGMELTLKQLAAAFGKFQLAEDNPAGEKFDPHRHQAISMVEGDTEPNTVVNVLQKGYRLHDRVIRPALVTVAKAKDA
jgi:molecular chaperone GrpE